MRGMSHTSTPPPAIPANSKSLSTKTRHAGYPVCVPVRRPPQVLVGPSQLSSGGSNTASGFRCGLPSRFVPRGRGGPPNSVWRLQTRLPGDGLLPFARSRADIVSRRRFAPPGQPLVMGMRSPRDCIAISGCAGPAAFVPPSSSPRAPARVRRRFSFPFFARPGARARRKAPPCAGIIGSKSVGPAWRVNGSAGLLSFLPELGTPPEDECGHAPDDARFWPSSSEPAPAAHPRARAERLCNRLGFDGNSQ